VNKKKVSVDDLAIGMYVAELDRSWLDSPFLFQGFAIESDDDLKQLRECCEHVFIDLEQGDDVSVTARPVDRKPPPTTRSQVTYAPGASGESAAMGSPGVAELHAEPSLSKALPEVNRVRQRATRFMDRLMSDIAKGRPLDAAEASEVVKELSRAVSLNVDASMWLNIIRHQHEYTAAHCVNVSVLALAFATYLGYEGEALETVGMGALMHDIGLIRMPKEILDKKAELLPEEMAQLRRHPLEGYRLLSPVSGIPPQVLDIIKYHHERIDGSGYPEGLSGDAIPREVLIVAIADMYEAMTSERPYARSMSPHGTVSVIRRVSPSAFGAGLVDEFMRFIGIYPVSTVVELNNHALGMVVSHTRQTRLKPVLIMLIKPDRSLFENFPLLDLSHTSEKRNPEEWQIMRVVDPTDYGLDVGKITAIYLDRLIASH